MVLSKPTNSLSKAAYLTVVRLANRSNPSMHRMLSLKKLTIDDYEAEVISKLSNANSI